MFCELPLHIVASATGISSSRLASIETGQREANPTERAILERFLQDRLRIVLQMDGEMPEWLSAPASLTEAGDD